MGYFFLYLSLYKKLKSEIWHIFCLAGRFIHLASTKG